MSTFADKYATAPALREITSSEIKPGMVVRATYGRESRVTIITWRMMNPVGFFNTPDRIELVEDVPDPREELAKRFADKLEPGKWTGLDTYGHDFYRRLADEATRWADERGQS